MRVRLAGVERRGRAVDLRDLSPAPGRVLAAVRDPDDDAVVCPPPGAVHEHVGHLHRGVALRRQSALADAARSRGLTAPQDDAVARLSADPAVEPAGAPPDPADARRELADAEADVTALRERVERLGGRVTERRAMDAPTAEAEARLRAAAAELAEAETAAVAARQRLDRAREGARERRDDRERALSRADRAANLRRAARAALAERVRPSFERALASVPGEGSDLGAAFAVARVARVTAPLVVEDGFDRAARAAACLDAPVLLV